MLKVGLIGAGFMGSMHAACYQALGNLDVKITAVADVREEKAKAVAEKTGAAIYATGLELIDKADLDIVDICLPTDLHTEHGIAAMKKGRAVFLEKPVCRTPEETELLLKAEEETKVPVMIGQCIRLWSEYKWFKEMVDKKTFGRIKSGVFKRLSSAPTWSWNGWLNDPDRSGTVALDMHVHDVDYIRYILGEPDEVFSKAVRNGDGVIQQIFSTYTYGDAVVSCEAGWDFPDNFPFTAGFRVKMDTATIVYDSTLSPSLVVYPVDAKPYSPVLDKEFEGKNEVGGNLSSLGGYYNELKYFIQKIKNKEALEVAPLREGVKSAKLCLREIEISGGVKNEAKGI